MSIHVDSKLTPAYAHVAFHGTWDNDALLALWEQVFQFAASHQRNAALVDIRGLTGTPPNTMDRYDHGVRVAELQKEIGRRIAIALVGEEPFVEPERFGELIFVQHGGLGKVFTDFQAAVDWLATNPANSRMT